MVKVMPGRGDIWAGVTGEVYMTAKKKKKSRGPAVTEPMPKKHIAVGILLGLLIFVMVIAGASYVMVANFYKTRFIKGTYINHFDCSNMTVEEVKTLITDEIMSYAINIEERDGITERLIAKDLGMAYVDDESVDQLLEEQNPYRWIFEFNKEKDVSISAISSFNEDIITESLQKLNCFDESVYEKPEDAYVKEGETSYEIVPEVEGTELDFDKVYEVVIDAVDRHEESVNLDENGCYKAPSVRSDDEELNSYIKKVNKYLKSVLHYDFGGEGRDITIDATKIKEWLIKGDDGLPELSKKGNPKLDESAIKAFVKSDMAKKYDTLGKPHKFKTHAGKTITLKNGFYGWRMNQDTTAEAMIKAIKQGKEQDMEVSYRYKAASRGEDDIGDTYVEVDITHQKMYCYKNGKLKVETDVVTGKPTKDRKTPSNGIWTIIYKKKDADLGTINDLGYSSHVDYWMPFNGNVGIHDADGWRTEYGGDIYKTNGSHGCVNTPKKAAKKIYNIVEKGTPVIVYGK